MKQLPLLPHLVTYKNGMKRTFDCRGTLECFCLATLFAMEQAWDPEIETIKTNDDTYSSFELNKIDSTTKLPFDINKL